MRNFARTQRRPPSDPQEKLLYLMNHYSVSGSSHFQHIVHLLEQIAEQGAHVLLLIEKADSLPEVHHPNIDVVGLRQDLGPAGRWFALASELNRALRAGYRTVFVRISVWSALSAIWACRFGRGKVFFWQSGTTIEFDRAQKWGRRKLVWFVRSRLPSKAVWRLVDRFVTGPQSMIDYYDRVGGISRSKIRLLYNDVDHSRFSWPADERVRLRRKLRASLHLSDDAIVILFVHRLSPVRRTLDYLPLALQRAKDAGALSDACVLVAGGGADLEELKERTERLNLSGAFRFLGDHPNHGIENLYAGADIFIQPSHAEGFPRVLVEAMVSGLPIVTTDAGGSGEILGPLQQRYVSPKDDPDEFGSALSLMLRSVDTWEALRQENMAIALRYDTPAVARMYREVLFGE